MLALLLLCGLTFLAACGKREDGAPRPVSGGGGQDAAPTGAAVLDSARAGGIVSSQAIPQAPAGTRAWRVIYRSRDRTGASIQVSGLILAPAATVPVPMGGRKVVSFAHGTTGIADACAPSRSQPPLFAVSWTFPLVYAGYVVALTDYPGLGGPGEHAIYVAEPEGISVLDAARAAAALKATGAGRDAILWGYSQGGQAVLAAGALSAAYAPDLRVRGIIATAPLADLPASLATLQQNPDGVAYTVLAAVGLSIDNPTINLEPVLTTTGRRLVAIARDRCVQDLTTASVGQSIGTVFTEDPLTHPPFSTGFARQRDAVLRRLPPTLVLQGDADLVIRRTVTDSVVNRLCDKGTQVDYRRYAFADHGTILGASMADLTGWLAERFGASPPAVHNVCALVGADQR